SNGKRECSVRAEVVNSSIRHEGIVRPPVHRICERSAKQPDNGVNTQILAPGICRLKTDSTRRTHGYLSVEAVVVVTRVIGDEIDRRELRIQHDEVFRESTLPQHSAIDAGRRGGQGGVEWARVIERV